MSYGFQVIINGTQVRLDDDYKNVVILGTKTVTLAAGYQEVSLLEYAHENMIACIRHLGFGVCFLGYIHSSGKRTGLRLYSSASGSANLACFVPFYTLPENGHGVILYSENGEQRFHSNHIYFDVKNTGYLSNGNIQTDQDMYVLSNPETPSISYTPHAQVISTPNWELVPYQLCFPTVNGETCLTLYRNEIVGYINSTYSWITSTKIISMTHQSSSGELSKANITLENEETVFDEFIAGTYNNVSNLSVPVVSHTINNPPSNSLSSVSPTITLESIV